MRRGQSWTVVSVVGLYALWAAGLPLWTGLIYIAIHLAIYAMDKRQQIIRKL